MLTVYLWGVAACWLAMVVYTLATNRTEAERQYGEPTKLAGVIIATMAAVFAAVVGLVVSWLVG